MVNYLTFLNATPSLQHPDLTSFLCPCLIRGKWHHYGRMRRKTPSCGLGKMRIGPTTWMIWTLQNHLHNGACHPILHPFNQSTPADRISPQFLIQKTCHQTPWRCHLPHPMGHHLPPLARDTPTLWHRQRKQWTTDIWPIGPLNATELDFRSPGEPPHVSPDTLEMSPATSSGPTPPITISGKWHQRSSPPLPSNQRHHSITLKTMRSCLMAIAMDYAIQLYESPQPLRKTTVVRPLEPIDILIPKKTRVQVH